MADFELFRALTLLYFVAASYSETLQRLDETRDVESFLLLNRKEFAVPFLQCLEAARRKPTGASRDALLKSIQKIIFVALSSWHITLYLIITYQMFPYLFLMYYISRLNFPKDPRYYE